MLSKKIALSIIASLSICSGAVFATAAYNSSNKLDDTVSAQTETTLYFAISDTDRADCSIILNINRQGDGDNWAKVSMSDTNTFFRDYRIFSCTFTDLYDGLGNIQFLIFSGAKQKECVQTSISSWTTPDVYNGKMYVYEYGRFIDHVTGDFQKATILVDCYNWSSLYAYSWEQVAGEEVKMFGDYPGTKIDIPDSNLVFHDGCLAAITVSYFDLDTFNFKFSDGQQSTRESSDYKLVLNSYYHYSMADGKWVIETNNAYTEGANFVYDFNNERLAVTASGDVKDYSICGLDASKWVNKYDSLSDEAKTLVNSSTIYTYKDQSSSGADTTVTFETMINYLRTRTIDNPSGLKLGTSVTNSVSVVTISIVGISIISLLAIVLQKKKHE